MGFTATPKNAALDAIGTQASWLSFHTGDPGSSGANEVTGGTYARVQTTWSAATAAAKAGTQVIADIPGGTTITHWGLWTASTAGTFCYGNPLTAPESFGLAGTYKYTPTLTATG
jgi:hypothetical protein